MYFVQYEPLKTKLRERTLTDREALPYYLFISALVSIATSLSVLIPTGAQPTVWDGVQGIASLAITVFGTLYCYTRNGEASGYDFIQKSVVLGWVVGFRCLLVFILIGIVVLIFRAMLYGLGNMSTTGLDFVTGVVFGCVVFERLGRHLKDTR